MLGLARVGDLATGTCTGHEHPITVAGTIMTGSSSIFAGGLCAAKVGDIVISSCGHTGVIVSGAQNVLVNGIQAATKGSYFVGTYTGYIVTCSENIFSGV
jgi:uncharacterized Zn-binding protein involved in type VI secretion